jgi:hypothetical protein
MLRFVNVSTWNAILILEKVRGWYYLISGSFPPIFLWNFRCPVLHRDIVIYPQQKISVTNFIELERAPVVRPIDSFPAFYGTRRFSTEFTRALHLFLSWARPIQSTSSHLTSPRSFLILSTHLRLDLPSGVCETKIKIMKEGLRQQGMCNGVRMGR